MCSKPGFLISKIDSYPKAIKNIASVFYYSFQIFQKKYQLLILQSTTGEI